MKQLSMWAKANVTPLFGLLITIAVLMTWTSESWAYGDYAAGCDSCHGGFRESPYTSLSDGSIWPNCITVGTLQSNCHRCIEIA